MNWEYACQGPHIPSIFGVPYFGFPIHPVSKMVESSWTRELSRPEAVPDLSRPAS